MLTPTLESIRDLIKKLQRESRRAYQAHDDIQKADHFYNFCVTAHSMKDYFFEEMGLKTDTEKQPYRTEWNKHSLLVAASEIANASKHLVLRKGTRKDIQQPKTKGVVRGEGDFVRLYDTNGGIKEELVSLPELFVDLEDGLIPLYEFVQHVEHYWYVFIETHDLIIDDCEILCRLGSMYHNGGGVQKNIEKALEYLCRSAELHNKDALNELGGIFLLGQDVPRNIVLALTLYNLVETQVKLDELPNFVSSSHIASAQQQAGEWNQSNWEELRRNILPG